MEGFTQEIVLKQRHKVHSYMHTLFKHGRNISYVKKSRFKKTYLHIARVEVLYKEGTRQLISFLKETWKWPIAAKCFAGY